MATKKASPAQLAARKKFAEMARSGAFKKRKSNPRPQHKTMQAGIDAAIKRFADSLQHWINEGYSFDEALERVKESSTLGPASIKKAIEMIGYKNNPIKKTVIKKFSQLTHEAYPQKQAVAVALSEKRAGKVKRNPEGKAIKASTLKIGDFIWYPQYSSSKKRFDYHWMEIIKISKKSDDLIFQVGYYPEDIRVAGKNELIMAKHSIVKKNPIDNEQHLFGNKYATIRQQGDGRFVAQIYEKVKTGIGEEIDLWGFKIYKTKTGAQRYLDSLKPVKTNPTRQRATRRTAVMQNPIEKNPKYKVQILEAGKKTWKRIAMFDSLDKAKTYAHAVPRTYKVVSVRVIDDKK